MDAEFNRELFADQVAVVTGAASGVGRFVADRLHTQGLRVAYVDVSATSLAQIPSAADAMTVECDVSNFDAVQACFQAVSDRWSRLDILVNAAGIGAPYVADELPIALWKRIVDIDLSGTFYTNLCAFRQMRSRRYGRIVNIASVAGKRISYNGCAAYTAAKAGVLGLTRHLAFEFARDGVTVNALCPSTILTPMVLQAADESVIAKRRATFPVGRTISLEDVYRSILYVASPHAGTICGVALDLDGGTQLGWDNVDDYFDRRALMRAKYESVR